MARLYLSLNAAITNLARRAEDYLTHFQQRGRYESNWFRENNRYREIFPNPRYEEESKAADAWQLRNYQMLLNMVFALNELISEVRKTLHPTYRLRDGRLGIHDSFGVANEGESCVIYPDGYIELS